MFFRIPIVFAILMLTACASQLEVGNILYSQGNYEAAKLQWLPLARAGDEAAQHNMGLLFEFGNSVQQSDVEASKWYLQSARNGFVLSMVRLANLQKKHGLKAEAITWYTLASRWNNEEARKQLRNMGENVPHPDLFNALKAQQDAMKAMLIGSALNGFVTGYYGSTSSPQETYTPSQQQLESNNFIALSDCNSDFQCGYGKKCVKPPMSTSGQCMEVVDVWGQKKISPPSSQSILPNISTQGSCQFDIDCPLLFRCDEALKVCIK